MKMLKVLFRQKLLSVGAWLTGSTRKRKTQSKGSSIAFLLIMLYAFGSIAFLYYTLLDVLAEPFRTAGIGWLYFSFVAVMSFGMMFIGSVFSSKSQLFEAKDNDLLLSLPVKSSDILLSRLFLLAVIDLAMGLIVMVPAGLVWFRNGGFEGAGLLFLIVALFLIMLIALSVAALFGWLLSLLTARLPVNRTAATLIFSLLFLGGYRYLISNMNQMIFRLAQDPEPALRTLGSVAPLVWIGHAVAEGDLSSLLKAAVLPLLSFAVMYILLSRTFIRTVTTKVSRKKIEYRGNTENALSVNKALLRREWQRLATNSAYIMNGCIGNILALIGAVVLLIKKDALQPLLADPGLGILLPGLFLLGTSFLGAMTLLTAPSVSLEGKNLWIIRSMPVSTQSLLRAKLQLHCLIGISSLLPLLIVLILILRPGLPMALLMLILPCTMVCYSAVVGLWAGIRHPNLDWTTEAQAVKSGMDVLIDMGVVFGTLLLPVIVILLFGAVLPLTAVAGGFIILVLLITLLLYRWLMTRGADRFEQLS